MILSCENDIQRFLLLLSNPVSKTDKERGKGSGKQKQNNNNGIRLLILNISQILLLSFPLPPSPLEHPMKSKLEQAEIHCPFQHMESNGSGLVFGAVGETSANVAKRPSFNPKHRFHQTGRREKGK